MNIVTLLLNLASSLQRQSLLAQKKCSQKFRETFGLVKLNEEFARENGQ